MGQGRYLFMMWFTGLRNLTRILDIKNQPKESKIKLIKKLKKILCSIIKTSLLILNIVIANHHLLVALDTQAHATNHAKRRGVSGLVWQLFYSFLQFL